MAREDTAGNPKVTRTLPQGYPNVTRTFTVGQALVAPTSLPRAHLHPACLARAPLAKCSFFRAKKKCVHVFFARRGDCRSRKMLQIEPNLAIVAVHTAENEPLKIWGYSFSYSVTSLITSTLPKSVVMTEAPEAAPFACSVMSSTTLPTAR